MKHAPIPEAAVDAVAEAHETCVTVLSLDGGTHLAWQYRGIGHSGRKATWVDGRPIADDALRRHLGRQLLGPTDQLIDEVWLEQRRFVSTITFSVEIAAEGAVAAAPTCELDVSTKLDGEVFNSVQSYLDNLASYPRDGDDVPIWMRPILARWGAWDPDTHRLTVDDHYRPDGTPTDMPDVEVDYWLPFDQTPEGPRRAHGYGDGNVGPGHTVTSPAELAAWRRANT